MEFLFALIGGEAQIIRNRTVLQIISGDLGLLGLIDEYV